MKKTRIIFGKFSDGKQNQQFHWPNTASGIRRDFSQIQSS